MKLKSLVMRPVIKKAPEHPPRKVKIGLPAIDPSCVLYLKMKELSGQLIDQSGNNNHGTVFGAAYGQAGRFGNALSFDGVDDYVSVLDNSNIDVGTNGFSVSVWFKGTSGSILGKGASGKGYSYIIRANAVTLYNTINGVFEEVNVGTYLDNVWHNVVLSFDYSTFSLQGYKDGVLSGTDTTYLGTVTTNSSAHLSIGEGWELLEPFNGTIEEVRIYNRALSASEIEAMYLQYLAFDTYKEV